MRRYATDRYIVMAVLWMLSVMLTLPSAAAELRNSLGNSVVRRTAAYSNHQTAEPHVHSPSSAVASDVYIEDGGGACNACCAPQAAGRMCGCRFYAGAQYLLWWSRGSSAPPLVTTSALGTDPLLAGILGEPTTSVLAGGDEFSASNPTSGGRLVLGMWTDSARCYAIETRLFALGESQFNYSIDSDQQPILARPFFDVALNSNEALEIAFSSPTATSAIGSVQVSNVLDVLGGDISLRRRLWRTPTWDLDFMLGYQFARIDDQLTISSLSSAFPAGPSLAVRDHFGAVNEFHGGVLGLLMRTEHGRLTLELLAKVGLGTMDERLTIDGTTVATDTLGGQSFDNSGLFAQELTNAGVYSRSDFAASPQFDMTLGYQISPCINFTFGYSFLYWSRLLRAAEQIDFGVDSRQFGQQTPADPPAARPAVIYSESGFWLQGMSFGLSYCF